MLVVVAFFMLLPEPQNQSEDIVKGESLLNHDFIIKNVRLYDGDQLFEDTDIEIKNSKVYKIATHIKTDKDIPIFNASGKTLLPGFIDAHTHAYGDALIDALNFGVTTELDMFTMPAFISSVRKNKQPNKNTTTADLFSSSILATTAGGHGTEYGFDIPVLTTPEQTKDFVENRIAEGADYIKAVYNSKQAKRQFFPSISQEILESLATNAHANHIMLVVHVDNLISAKQAIKAGANGVVHSFMDEVADDEFIQLMKVNDAFMIPTLSVEASISQLFEPKKLLDDTHVIDYISRQQKQQLKATFPEFGIPKDAFGRALESVKKLSQAGISILAGTDAPNPGTTHGLSIHQELDLLIQAGLTHQQAIHSATGAARKYFPIGMRGTLKTGALASMILVDGNPFMDINQTRNIMKIWKNGKLVQRLTHKDTGQQTHMNAGLISDFNQSIELTKIGQGITSSTDQYAGGNSIVKLSLKDRMGDKDKYLHAKGELKNGFMYKWGGLSFIPGKDMQNGVNLTKIKSLTFEAKAGHNTETVSIQLFQSGSYQPSEIKIKLDQQWKTFDINLGDFKNIDMTDIVNISFSVTSKLGPYEFMLDNLYFRD